MNLATYSLVALLVAIAISCTARVNVGLLAIVFAWLVGTILGGMKLGEVLGGFPVQLLLTLLGVTLLFAGAQGNGTLDLLAGRAVRLCRGNAGLVPVMFFFLASSLGSLGAGNIAAAAIVAPMAMAVARRAAIPAFLMAIMVGNGASSGSMSPFAPAGIVAADIFARTGLSGIEARIYFNNLFAHLLVAAGGYLALGGWRLFARRQPVEDAAEAGVAAAAVPAGSTTASQQRPAMAVDVAASFERRHWVTLVVLAVWVAAVLAGTNVGIAALVAVIALTLLAGVDEAEAIRRIPWGVIVMVCGVTTLVTLLEKTGGLDLFTALLARVSTQHTVTGTIALITGLISIYSSTSGVVLPALLPTVPGLIERLGGGDPVAVVSSITVGSHLVDVSPLSTIGALCIAAAGAAGAETDARGLFNRMLAWGVSMALVGGILCLVVFGVLGL